VNKVIHGLITAVFGIACLFLSWMLKLVSEALPGMRLPAFSSFCVSLRPLLFVLPTLAAGYCLYVWFGKDAARKSWVGFFAGAMLTVVFIMIPTMIAAWLPVLDLVNHLAARHP
jgi:hypothetical protein